MTVSPFAFSRRHRPQAPSAGQVKDAKHRGLLAAARAPARVLDLPEHGATLAKPSESIHFVFARRLSDVAMVLAQFKDGRRSGRR